MPKVFTPDERTRFVSAIGHLAKAGDELVDACANIPTLCNAELHCPKLAVNNLRKSVSHHIGTAEAILAEEE